MGTTFKKVKKTSETYWETPSMFQGKTGIVNISESGICHFGKYYEKAYYISDSKKEKASTSEKMKGITMVLRSFDIPYQYIEIETGEVILSVFVQGKDFEEAKTIITHLETEMISSLYTFGIVIEPMKVQERLRYIHQQQLQKMEKRRLDINDYIKNTSWVQDLNNDKVKEVPTGMYMKTEIEEKGYYYVRRVPSEHYRNLYETLRTEENVLDIFLDYQPISDCCVKDKMIELYEDAHGLSCGEEDQRKYVLAGVYFSVGKTEKQISSAIKNIRENLKIFGGEVTCYYYSQMNANKAFQTFDTKEILQQRIVKVSNVVAVNPFGEQNENHEEKKDQTLLLKEFDAMMGGEE